MVKSMTNREVNLEGLIGAAQSEDWDRVDVVLPELVDNPETVSWATQALDDKDGNLRDLAASIFERSQIDLQPEVQGRLRLMISVDENPYAQFRAAFALFSRGDRSPEVMAKMNEAMKDPDVKEIAERYLSK